MMIEETGFESIHTPVLSIVQDIKNCVNFYISMSILLWGNIYAQSTSRSTAVFFNR
jgi:hypothetical protein